MLPAAVSLVIAHVDVQLVRVPTRPTATPGLVPRLTRRPAWPPASCHRIEWRRSARCQAACYQCFITKWRVVSLLACRDLSGLGRFQHPFCRQAGSVGSSPVILHCSAAPAALSAGRSTFLLCVTHPVCASTPSAAAKLGSDLVPPNVGA